MNLKTLVNKSWYGTIGYIAKEEDLETLEQYILYNLPVLREYKNIVVATNYGAELQQQNKELWKSYFPESVIIDNPTTVEKKPISLNQLTDKMYALSAGALVTNETFLIEEVIAYIDNINNIYDKNDYKYDEVLTGAAYSIFNSPAVDMAVTNQNDYIARQTREYYIYESNRTKVFIFTAILNNLEDPDGFTTRIGVFDNHFDKTL